MSYTDLPTEVLTQIASHLDVSTAIFLAQTSSFSTQAAESRIWRDVKIDDLNRFATPNGPSFDEAEAEVKGEQYYQPYISLILLRPYRSTLIRSLEVKPQFNPPPELTQLLKLIGGGLHHLSIKYPTGLLTPLKPLKMIAKMIEEIVSPALEEIEVDLGDWGCLENLLRSSRGLKKLAIRGPESSGSVTASAMALGMGMSGTDSTVNPTLNTMPPTNIVVPEYIRLEYLSIDRMDAAVAPLLAKIVTNSPRLKTVILGDPMNLWFSFPSPSAADNIHSTSPQDDVLLLALSTATSMTSLAVPSTCLKPMESVIAREGGFDKIEDLAIVWEYPHLYACSGGKEPVNTQEILLPTLPGLKNSIFTLRTHHCDPDAPPYSIYRGHVFDLCIKAIKRHAHLTQFESTPLLESIQLRDMYGSKAKTSHPRCETEFDGALVTRYRAVEGDLLVVVRHRVAHSCGWEEYGVYGGREVPKSCLDGVMSVNGTSGRREPIKPGWGELNENAWDVLRHWATLS